MMNGAPGLSYTIWTTQRTGSTLLCHALASTGIAGNPAEWLLTHHVDLHEHYGVDDDAGLVAEVRRRGGTPNGVFALKMSFYEPYMSELTRRWRALPGSPGPEASAVAAWEHVFPRGRHIFLTRRNKVRLAVSWWKAIQSAEWHRRRGAPAAATDLADAYSYEAIRHLFNESVMREAGIEAFFTEAGIVPLTVVYEDFIRTYDSTVRRILRFLGLDGGDATIAPPGFARLADEVSEEWVQRFREEHQMGWEHRGW